QSVSIASAASVSLSRTASRYARSRASGSVSSSDVQTIEPLTASTTARNPTVHLREFVATSALTQAETASQTRSQMSSGAGAGRSDSVTDTATSRESVSGSSAAAGESGSLFNSDSNGLWERLLEILEPGVKSRFAPWRYCAASTPR